MSGSGENFFRDPSYRFHRGLVVEHIFSRHYRAWVTATTGTIVLVYLLALAESRYSAGAAFKEYFTLPPDTPIVNGVFLIALAVFLLMKMIKSYSRSYYYYVEGLLERGKSGAQTPYTTPNYEVCNIYYETENGDLLKGFAHSKQGGKILRRLGIADETHPEKCERELMKIISPENWNDAGMAFSFLGREICRPTDPKCGECTLNAACAYYASSPKV